MLAFLLACRGPDPDPHRPDPEPEPTDTAVTETGRPPPTTFPTDSGTPTGDTGTPPPDPCAAVPRQLLSQQRMADVPLSEEFAFDADGHLLNAVDTRGVYKTTYDGDSTLFSPGFSLEFAGARVAPDGTWMALCDEGRGAIVRVELDGGDRTDILSIPNPNSLGFDRWGRMWIGATDAIYRWDPASADPPEEVLDRRGADMDGITFSPDFRFVYFNDDTGRDVGAIELDADGEVVGQTRYVDLAREASSELDGMTTDACGNLYVTVTNGKILRVWSDLTVQTLVPATGRYTTAASFGSGLGGWGRDRLYVMDRTDGVWELELGVDGRPEPHLP